MGVTLSVLGDHYFCKTVRQTAGWIKMPLAMEVGLGPGHIVSHGDPPPPPQGGTAPQFLAHVCCRQMARWIKMPLGMERLGVGPGDIGCMVSICFIYNFIHICLSRIPGIITD